MVNKTQTLKSPCNYVAYFSLCQEIGMTLEEVGRGIVKDGVYAPVFHRDIIGDLERLKRYCDRAIEVVNMAQAEWKNKTCSAIC